MRLLPVELDIVEVVHVVERADADAVAAGFVRLSELAVDPRTGLRTSTFREPSGNLVELREAASS